LCSEYGRQLNVDVIYCDLQMKQWAEVELPPGQFLGSTGVQTLTPDELGTEDRRFQAWVKKV